MSRGGLKQETIVRKQLERAELGRDACRMKRCGMSYREIAKVLGCSHETVHRLVQEGIAAYKAEGKQDAGEMIEAMIADLLKSSQELWIQWERSKQDKCRITKKTIGRKKETTEMTEGSRGDPRYMAEFRANMESIARLRGVFSSDDEEQDVFEEYREEMESSFDPPPPEMIEDAQHGQSTNGDGSNGDGKANN